MGFACARVLALSSFSLISSIIVSGSIAVAGGFPLIEAPAHRVAKMSAILIGASAAGCILGAWMTGAIGKNDDEKLTEIVTDGGNFFVCAMHPYGKRRCEDREQK